jgi:hypothetical protein
MSHKIAANIPLGYGVLTRLLTRYHPKLFQFSFNQILGSCILIST